MQISRPESGKTYSFDSRYLSIDNAKAAAKSIVNNNGVHAYYQKTVVSGEVLFDVRVENVTKIAGEDLNTNPVTSTLAGADDRSYEAAKRFIDEHDELFSEGIPLDFDSFNLWYKKNKIAATGALRGTTYRRARRMYFNQYLLPA